VSALRWEQTIAKRKGVKAAWVTRKPSAKTVKAAPPATLHGADLVRGVIEMLREKKHRARKRQKPRLGAHALPPSLDAWLSYDSSRIESSKRESLHDLAMSMGGTPIRSKHPLTGDCFRLVTGDEQVTFLYAGRAASDGELPVLTLAVDEEPVVVLSAPGFDVYLAQYTGYFPEAETLGDVPPQYEARMREQAKLNMKGKRTLAYLATEGRIREKRTSK
jgi:hypothetical protein